MKNRRAYEKRSARMQTRGRGYKNIYQHRPPKPALGRGRCQVAAERAAFVLGGGTFTTADVAQWCYASRILLHGKRLRPAHYATVRRALELIATPIGRASGRHGAPTLWRLR